jgi:hypothetical protein
VNLIPLLQVRSKSSNYGGAGVMHGSATSEPGSRCLEGEPSKFSMEVMQHCWKTPIDLKRLFVVFLTGMRISYLAIEITAATCMAAMKTNRS